MRLMATAGGGILIYLAQEGRDIGLLNKMRAYALQDYGMDTIDANHALGFDTDERVFVPAARILAALNVSQVRLITNNPDKIDQLEQCGITVAARVPLALGIIRIMPPIWPLKKKEPVICLTMLSSLTTYPTTRDKNDG